MTDSTDGAPPLSVFLTLLAFIAFLVWGFGALITAQDRDYWQRIDVDGECYVHVQEVRNAWLTPGDESETRNTYCQKA